MAPAPSAKRAPLTLAQIAAHDDKLTEALVDRFYFWSEIRKNAPRYTANRSLTEAAVTSIVKRRVIVEDDTKTAMKELEKLQGIRAYTSRLKKDQLEHFRDHMEKYVDIWRSDCPFEITTTNRFTFEHEASVTARKFIKRGQKIPYLCGVQVGISDDEERKLDSVRRNFSIVYSSRKKTQSVFLGPARFSNHDCNANARLQSTEGDRMEVYATRNIEVGEEITVSYGSDYFGEGNCDCLCSACEFACTGGWQQMDAEIKAVDSEPEPTTDGAQRPKLKRMFDEFSEVTSRAETPESYAASQKRSRTEEEPRKLSDLVHEAFPLSLRPSEITNNASTPEDSDTPFAISVDRSGTPSQSPVSTPATAFSEEGVSVESAPAASLTNDTTKVLVSETVESAETPLVQTSVSVVINAPLRPQVKTLVQRVAEEDLIMSELSDASIDDERQLATRRSYSSPTDAHPMGNATSSQTASRKKKNKSLELTQASSPSQRQKRVPGDYNTKRALLAYPGSRRNECEICEKHWIQENGHEPRICCQRCERHSKLYGYTWPKTQNEEGGEKEVRILDHRLVNLVRSKKKKWELELELEQAAMTAKGKKKKVAVEEEGDKKPKSYGGLWAKWKPGFMEPKKVRKANLKTKGNGKGAGSKMKGAAGINKRH